jgi:microcystin degradation protein MlrC
VGTVSHPRDRAVGAEAVVGKIDRHFAGVFARIAGTLIYGDSDALRRGDYHKIPYMLIKRPIRPFDAEAISDLIA